LSSGAASTLHADIFEAWAGNSLQNRISGRGGRGGQRPAATVGQNGQQAADVTGAQAVVTDQAQAATTGAGAGQGNRGDGGRRGPGQRGGGAVPVAPAA
jgi:hypothetical protein